MVLLQHKLSVRLSQRQILTPGLVQMVSVLALNKLELKDMINAEMVENPVLEELEDSVPLLDEVGKKEEDRERAAAASNEENPTTAAEKKDPFEEIDFGSLDRKTRFPCSTKLARRKKTVSAPLPPATKKIPPLQPKRKIRSKRSISVRSSRIISTPATVLTARWRTSSVRRLRIFSPSQQISPTTLPGSWARSVCAEKYAKPPT